MLLDSNLSHVCATGASFVVLVPQTLVLWKKRSSLGTKGPQAPAHFGLREILSFKIARSGTTCALLGVVIGAMFKFGAGGPSWLLLSSVGYASVLSVLSFVAPTTTRLLAHSTFVLVFLLSSYIYRDIWPLCTYNLEPVDSAQGVFLWAQLGLCVLATVILPMLEPFPYVPVDALHPQTAVNPEQTASLASYLYYNYVDGIIVYAHRNSHRSRPVLPPLADVDHTKILLQEARSHLGSGPVVLLRGLFMIFKVSIALQIANTLVECVVAYAGPFGTNRLLQYLETNGEGATVRPWVWILVISIGGSFMDTITGHYGYYLSDRTFVRMQSILTSLVFEHALKMRLKEDALDSTSGSSDPGRTSAEGQEVDMSNGKPGGAAVTGILTDLITSDLDNLHSGNEFVGSVIASPIKLVLGIIFVYFVLDWSAFVGLAIMIILLPVPAKLASWMSGYQDLKMTATDRRVNAITETLGVLRMIKLFAFSDVVAADIDEKRAEELRYVWTLKVLQVSNQVFSLIIPLCHLLFSFLCYTLIQKRPLTASIVFSVVKAFSVIRDQIQALVYDTPGLIGSYVSLRRIENFLNKTELIDTHSRLGRSEANNHSLDIGLGHASFTWSTDPSQRFTLQVNGDVIFAPGCINLVVGPTGSGKTALLLALLGEMHLVSNGMQSWVNLPRTNGVAYAAQESWVLNDTIRNNIVFGSDFDERRYKKVLFQCALEQDLSLFQAGDETEVGEKGLTLSGGQRARVTLARAIYSSAQVILLDDVFAALDVHTARWIVDTCFRGDLIKGRTVILVTHNIALTNSLAKLVIMIEDGQIKSMGSPASVLTSVPSLSQEVQREHTLMKADEATEAALDVKPSEAPEIVGAKLIADEEIEIGRVSWDAWKIYYSAMGGNWPVLFWLAAFGSDTLRQTGVVVGTWWLGEWSKAYLNSPAQDVSVA